MKTINNMWCKSFHKCWIQTNKPRQGTTHSLTRSIFIIISLLYSKVRGHQVSQNEAMEALQRGEVSYVYMIQN